MNVYDGILQFNGTFRAYQQRVLDRAEIYLKDGKIHVVAAPGSGKTTLGIELIRRIGRPALIISPRLVIRDQWIERIENAFLQSNKKNVLSKDLTHPALITSITYQTLFSAMTKYKGTEQENTDEEGESQKEEVDFSHFDIMKVIKEAEIEILCLDECHHLRSEWWKALEEFTGYLKKTGLKVIALTATPPYDSNKTEWERYTNMCGTVDEEIIVPELVQEKCLCPHQDYVMFSFPTKDEKKKIDEYDRVVKECFEQLMNDQELASIVSSHYGIKNYDENYDQMMEQPAYLSALLMYYNAHGIQFDKRWKKLLGVKLFPQMEPQWMQVLLQGFLYDDIDNFECANEYREELIKELKRRQLIVRRKVSFVENEAIKKVMINSLGKLDSIIKIAESEYSDLGKELRMLVLTDYIKKEYKKAIGFQKEDVHSIGVLPVFENLRRVMPKECRLGVLCGSIVILPDTAVDVLRKIVQERLGEESLITSKCIIGENNASIGYSEIFITGKNSEIVNLVTEVFEKGCFEIMIGTKSLLGEGYDSPCVNSLILASFVGSFVLSNQMRGRAIRVQQGNPEKTANIWHLVCVQNADRISTDSIMLRETKPDSLDYETLKRRMQTFLGVSYDGAYIENGMGRLSIIKEPFTTKNIKYINSKMLSMSKDRDKLREQWIEAVTIENGMEVVEQFEMEKRFLREKVYFWDILGWLAFNSFVGTGFYNLLRFNFKLFHNDLDLLIPCVFVSALLFWVLVRVNYRFIVRSNPTFYIKTIGNSILKSLNMIGEITSDCRVATEESDFRKAVFLKGGTSREKEVFIQCVEEFFGVIENQRYILFKEGPGYNKYKYFCVPQLFAKRKEDAKIFADNMQSIVGRYKLIYTRNPEGRKKLIKARAQAYANILKAMEDNASEKGRRKKKLNQKLI